MVRTILSYKNTSLPQTRTTSAMAAVAGTRAQCAPLLLVMLMTAQVFLFFLPFGGANAEAADAGSPRPSMPGGWKKIAEEDLKNVTGIGKYAISEHNKGLAKEQQLKFVKLLQGFTQVVSGVNYKLDLNATDSTSASGTYRAIVWVKAWQKFQKLVSFEKL